MMSSLPPHEEIIFPALSPTMETGTIARWVKREGEQVEADEVLAEIETDKATVDYNATDEGFVAKILVDEGVPDVEVGSVIAIMVESEEDIAAFANYVPSSAPKTKEEDAAPPSTPPPPETNVSQTPSPSLQSSGSNDGRVFASPLAKKLVREHGDVPLNLSDIQGSGPNGRVLRDDVLKALENPTTVSSSPTSTTAAPAVPFSSGGGAFEDVEASRIRQIIAQSTTASKQNVPHYYLTVELELESLLNLRAHLNENTSDDTKISVNDFIVKASALACKAVPEVNSSWITKEDGTNVIRTYEHVDVNVGMSTDIGLLSPIVRDAHSIGLTSISSRIRSLAAGAKENTLQPSDHESGTFTVSNLGMFGIKQFTAIISEPQVCILAVGAAEDRVVPNDDETSPEIYKIEKRMNVTLSCDHRVVDGAVGAQWLQAFKSLIEDPVKMML